MKGFRISAFWQAILIAIAAYFVFDNAFPPVLPKTLMIQYMIITVIGILLYYAFDDKKWAEFKSPVLRTLREKNRWPARWLVLTALPILLAYTTYQSIKPNHEAPVELRQVHPAPPATVKAYGNSYNLAKLENPVREEILKTMASDEDAGWEQYDESILAGRDIYYGNCFFCHGDLLDGQGHYAKGFNPQPINFQDPTIIPQLQESFLFWRIAAGGPGLPKEGTPWNSAMPVWHEILEEDDIWNVINFIFDYNGQVPRIWDPDISRVVTGMKDKVLQKRRELKGKELYQFRCEVCHGETGAGDGVAADLMYPRARDFSLGMYKYKTSPGTTLPRDEDLFRTIKYGLDGTAMPGWGLEGSALLTDEQISSLIPEIKRFDVTQSWTPEDVEDEAFDDDGFYLEDDFTVITDLEPLDGQISYTEESIALGKVAFEKSCTECHGDAGRGNILSGKKLEDDWGYRIWPRDLTKPWTWRYTQSQSGPESERQETIRSIYTRLSTGILGTPMPAHRAVEEGNKDPVSLTDRWHIANYVYSLRETQTQPDDAPVVAGIKIEGALPQSVDDERWQQAKPVSLYLVPNIIKEDRLFTPLNDSVTVRTLYNDDDISFLLEVADRTESRPGIEYFTDLQDEELEMHSDAFAIQFPDEESYTSSPMVDKPLYRHGDNRHTTTIWYWNAGSVDPEKAPMSALLEGKGPDKQLALREDSSDLIAQGQWQDGQWQVIMQRPRISSNKDVVFEEGQFIPISFANWDGSNGEIGSKHTLSTWYWLLLPPETNNVRVYGIPLVFGLMLFGAGLLLVRYQLKRGPDIL